MCLIILAYQAIPDYPLIAAANRDEFYSRPARGAHFWPNNPNGKQILAGQDLLAGGTWLGINREGRFAAVTNWRDPSRSEHKPYSRGELPVRFLQSSLTAFDYAESLKDSFDSYAGFNLLVGDHNNMVYINNVNCQLQQLNPGIYGLSNGMLDSHWPKVQRGRQRMQTLLDQPDQLSTEALINLMGDRQQADDSALPDTGISIEKERELSPLFIHSQGRNYGTRNSTAVIIQSSGVVRFFEQNFDSSGNPGSTCSHNFSHVSDT